MKKIPFLILIIIISACAPVQKNNDDWQKYPAWLLKPQSTITGLSPRYHYEDKSMDVSLQAAIDKYGKLEYCLVKGGQTFIQTPEGISIVDDSLFVRPFTNEKYADLFFYEYAPVDTFYAKGYIAVCFANKNSSHPIKTDHIPLKEECEWVNEPPRDQENKYLYALGYCDILADEFRSWQYAENNAILNLAKQISIDKVGEELRSDGTRMSKSVENINVELHNIEIVERWKDERYNIYYVLVKMKN